MNIAIIKQSGGKYLFEVPESITLKEGEKVKCDTRRGVADGIVWADSITVDEPAAKLIGKLLGANFPLKSVVGKTVTSVEMFEQPAQPKQEHVKLYCVEDCSGFTTKGKIYEFTDGDIRLDDGTHCAGWFTDYADFVSDNRSIAACLVPLVSRAAQVGEWVYIKKKIGDYTYNVGDIGKVEKTHPQSGSIRAFGGVYVMAEEYLVLDGYKPEPEKAEPEYYNGKVVCVENGYGKSRPLPDLTPGKVYDIVNGILTDDKGYEYEPYKTLDDICVALGNTFIEFKGE